jgi:hypothetical protein
MQLLYLINLKYLKIITAFIPLNVFYANPFERKPDSEQTFTKNYVFKVWTQKYEQLKVFVGRTVMRCNQLLHTYVAKK